MEKADNWQNLISMEGARLARDDDTISIPLLRGIC